MQDLQREQSSNSDNSQETQGPYVNFHRQYGRCEYSEGFAGAVQPATEIKSCPQIFRPRSP